MISMRRWPTPVGERAGERRGERRRVGQEAEEQARRERVPPSSRMWNGAVGSSWNAERKTVNVKPHITKKRGVNSDLRPHRSAV